MITEKEHSIVDEVHAMKEANAARFDFDIARIIESARLRQEDSGRRIIRVGVIVATEQPTVRPESKSPS